MIQIRKSSERGQGHYGWLKAQYSFSFAGYFDPRHRGFRDLLVINEDRIQPSSGFETHPHDNMEIVTYMISGEIEHEDSMGNKSRIREGQLQRMSAGTGITHSEKNPSSENESHLLQIWIHTQKRNIEPSYENISFEANNELKLLVSPNGEKGSSVIYQDVYFYGAQLETQKEVKFELKPYRYAWVQVTKGSLKLNHETLNQGDGASVAQESQLLFTAVDNCEFLLIDLK